MIDNTQDIIDSRDVITRMDELQDQYIADINGEEGSSWTDEDQRELITLEDLARQGESNAEDWYHGSTFIRYDYFTEYAKDLAMDTASDPEHLRMMNDEWPFNCIDWEKAADDLLVDYSEVTFDGVTYYIR